MTTRVRINIPWSTFHGREGVLVATWPEENKGSVELAREDESYAPYVIPFPLDSLEPIDAE